MASTTSFALMLALTTVADVQLLFFSSQTCPPCQQVKPVVQQLIQQGYPIQQIDVGQSPQLANQLNVTQIPCFVLTVDGQEVDRVLGAQPAQVLAGMFAKANPSGNAAAPRPTAGGAVSQANYETRGNAGGGYTPELPSPPANQAAGSDEYNGWRDGIGFVSTHQATRPQQTALTSSVRLHVDENQSVAVGSGTVIHQEGDSALVLTCGHLFRETGVEASVTVDVGFPGAPVKVPAKVLYYDADKHDVALVVIRTDRSLPVARLAPRQFRPRVGDQVFGVGCGGGEDPSILGTRIKALTNYSGITKYDTFVRPQQGRSGGGLFSSGGQLMGVCNAAAVNVDEGIYAGLDSIYAILDANNMTEMVTATPATTLAGHTQPASQPTLPQQVAGQPATLQGTGQPVMPEPPMSAPVTIPVNTVAPPSTTTPVEVICVIRSPEDPSKTQTVTIRNPSPDLLKQIYQANQASNEKWQSVPARTANVRAQSPR